MIISIVTGIILMGSVFVPQFGENALEMEEGSGGYLVMVLAVFSGIGAPVSGKLIDRFGDPPRAVCNLLEIAQIKALGNAIGISDISQKMSEVHFEFADGRITPEIVQFMVTNYPKNTVISSQGKPVIKYRYTGEILGNIKFLLQQLNGLHTEEK